MNVVGRLACLCLVGLAGCGSSSPTELETALKTDLQHEIEASGRKVLNMHCPEERPFCIARVRTSKGDHFTAVAYTGSGADATVARHIDQGLVRTGPLDDGVKRDLEAMFDTEFTHVDCERANYQCHARAADGRRIAVLLALDDSDDYSIVTTGEE